MRALNRLKLHERKYVTMELTELNLTEEQLNGVNAILQSEGDKIRTKYSKEIEGLKGKIPKEKDAETLAYEKEKADFMKEKQQYELSKKLSDKGLSSLSLIHI